MNIEESNIRRLESLMGKIGGRSISIFPGERFYESTPEEVAGQLADSIERLLEKGVFEGESREIDEGTRNI